MILTKESFYKLQGFHSSSIFDVPNDAETMQDVWDRAPPVVLFEIATRPSVLLDTELRKFCCWCHRQIWHLLDNVCKHVVEDNELYANNLLALSVFMGRRERAYRGYKNSTNNAVQSVFEAANTGLAGQHGFDAIIRAMHALDADTRNTPQCIYNSGAFATQLRKTCTPNFGVKVETQRCCVLVASGHDGYDDGNALCFMDKGVSAFYFNAPIGDNDIIHFMAHGVLFDNDWCNEDNCSKIMVQKDNDSDWEKLS